MKKLPDDFLWTLSVYPGYGLLKPPRSLEQGSQELDALEIPAGPQAIRSLHFMAEQLNVAHLLDYLRAEERDTVEIPHDNASFDGPNNVVYCIGAWVTPVGEKFRGDTLLEALSAAALCKLNTLTREES